MTGANRLVGYAAALLLLATVTAAPAHAQFGGFGGGGSGGTDMMTQMAPMLEMMKAKMGKKRFAMLMQTMGPMMSRMMENGGFGGMGMGMGGFGGGMMPTGFGGGITPEAVGMSPGVGYAGGGDFMGMMGGMGGGEMMAMIPQLMQLANTGGGKRRHRRH